MDNKKNENNGQPSHIAGVYDGSNLESFIENTGNDEVDVVTHDSNNSAQSITTWLVDVISREIDIDKQEVDIDTDFSEFGISSIDVVTISGEIEERFGIRMSPEEMYDYTTVSDLAKYISSKLYKEI